MRGPLLVASGLAFLAIVAPPIAIFVFHDLGLFIVSLIGALVCGLVCLAFLLIGLFYFRAKALWFAVPLAVALVWPINAVVSYHLCEAQGPPANYDCMP